MTAFAGNAARFSYPARNGAEARRSLVGPDTPQRARLARAIEVFLPDLVSQLPSTKDILRRCDHGFDETWVAVESVRCRTLIPRRPWPPPWLAARRLRQGGAALRVDT